jgi:hypothetical protein
MQGVRGSNPLSSTTTTPQSQPRPPPSPACRCLTTRTGTTCVPLRPVAAPRTAPRRPGSPHPERPRSPRPRQASRLAGTARPPRRRAHPAHRLPGTRPAAVDSAAGDRRPTVRSSDLGIEGRTGVAHGHVPGQGPSLRLRSARPAGAGPLPGAVADARPDSWLPAAAGALHRRRRPAGAAPARPAMIRPVHLAACQRASRHRGRASPSG